MLSVEDRKVLDKVAQKSSPFNTWKELKAGYCSLSSRSCQGLVERAVVLSRQSVEARVVEASKLSLVEFLHFVGCLSRDRAKAGDEKNG